MDEKRKKFWQFRLSTLFGVVLVCALGFWAWREMFPSRENWRLLQPGMTSREARALLGWPEYRVTINDWSTASYEIADDRWLWVTEERGEVIDVEYGDRMPPE